MCFNIACWRRLCVLTCVLEKIVCFYMCVGEDCVFLHACWRRLCVLTCVLEKIVCFNTHVGEDCVF